MTNPNGPTLNFAARSEQTVTLATLPGGSARPVSARIDWGDGSASAGQLSDDGQRGYSLTGGHAYARGGNYGIRALVTRADGTTTAINAVADVASTQVGRR